MNLPDRTAKKMVVAAIFATVAGVAAGQAETYPSRPITIIGPFAAGGPADVLARIIGERMKASLGQPVISENVTGAGGSLALARVARATPDGYTLSLGNWGTHVINGAIYTLKYDVQGDFEPIALLASNPELIVARSTFPAKNLQEAIAWLMHRRSRFPQGGSDDAGRVWIGNVALATLTRPRPEQRSSARTSVIHVACRAT